MLDKSLGSPALCRTAEARTPSSSKLEKVPPETLRYAERAIAHANTPNARGVIYATRRETSHFAGDPCSFVALDPKQRVRLIAEMLGNPPEEIPWATRVFTNIEFQSVQEFNVALLAFVEEQQQMYRETAEALESRGLLEKSEAQQSIPMMHLSLNDERGKGADPISEDAIHLPDRVESPP